MFKEITKAGHVLNIVGSNRFLISVLRDKVQ